MKAHFSIITVLLLITFNCFSQAQQPRAPKQKKPFKLNTELLKQKKTVAPPLSNVTSPLSRTKFTMNDSLLLRHKKIKHN